MKRIKYMKQMRNTPRPTISNEWDVPSV
jgi:hypothetical protein